jgi:hypothetical protein
MQVPRPKLRPGHPGKARLRYAEGVLGRLRAFAEFILADSTVMWAVASHEIIWKGIGGWRGCDWVDYRNGPIGSPGCDIYWATENTISGSVQASIGDTVPTQIGDLNLTISGAIGESIGHSFGVYGFVTYTVADLGKKAIGYVQWAVIQEKI